MPAGLWSPGAPTASKRSLPRRVRRIGARHERQTGLAARCPRTRSVRIGLNAASESHRPIRFVECSALALVALLRRRCCGLRADAGEFAADSSPRAPPTRSEAVPAAGDRRVGNTGAADGDLGVGVPPLARDHRQGPAAAVVVATLGEAELGGHSAGVRTRPSKDDADRWVAPRLLRATTDGDTLRLIASTRVGQTVDDLAEAVPAIGSAARATATRYAVLDSATVQIDLVMRDALALFTYADFPADVAMDHVLLGRRQDGTDWYLPLRGRHTLVAGCSGSGKGSVLWGICGGLVPAAHTDVARLLAIDLKRGVEVTMGADLFSVIAASPSDALAVLRALLNVIDDRGGAWPGGAGLTGPPELFTSDTSAPTSTCPTRRPDPHRPRSLR